KKRQAAALVTVLVVVRTSVKCLSPRQRSSTLISTGWATDWKAASRWLAGRGVPSAGGGTALGAAICRGPGWRGARLHGSWFFSGKIVVASCQLPSLAFTQVRAPRMAFGRVL